MDLIARLREARAAAGGDEWVAMPRLGANRAEMEAYWTRLIEAGNTLVAVDVTTNRRNQPGVDEASTRFIVLAANHIDALLDVCEAARAVRLTNAGKGHPDSEADVVLDAALARLEATDARE